jgi:hypothetical protein
MVDVFISYSKTNEPVVRRLADAVKRLGYSVWWDDELPPHLSYSDVITDTIGSAKAAIVVWSERAAASEWVRAEADVARAQKKLIQTSIDGRMPPMPFNQIQFASIGDWQGEDSHPGWMKVKASLAALCGPPAAETQATVAAPAAQSRPPAAAAPSPSGGGRMLVPALLGMLVLAAFAGLYLLWSRGGGESAAPGNQVAAVPAAAPAAAPAPAPVQDLPPARTDGTFTEAATLEGAYPSTDVRGGPSADAFVVGRIDRGEVFTTYPQQGDWWKVRTANGTAGYVAHARIRLIPAQASAPAPAHMAAVHRPAAAPPAVQAQPVPTPAQAPKPAAGQGQPQVLNMPFNPRRYCSGPGRGTPECIQLRQRMARQRAIQGGY